MLNSHTRPEPPYGPSTASVFVWLLAISSIWHYTSSAEEISTHWFRYDPLGTPLIFLSISTALIAATAPNKTGALLLFAVGQLVAIGVRFPRVADHQVMELLLSLSIVLTYCYAAFSRRTIKIATTEMFELYSPIGRWLLIIMYFYGTFHKINAGFLSPQSSCALPFLNGFPLPERILDDVRIQCLAIYGTLVIEFAAMLLLFSARTKYYGMLLGMSFHFMVGTSAFGTLAHFSAFAMALHSLFLPSSFGRRVYADPWVPAWLKDVRTFRSASILFVVLQVVLALHMGVTHRGYLVNLLFAAFGISLLSLVGRHGQARPGDASYRLVSPFALANMVPASFFLYCLSPYIGLGTGGALAMFSGLRTEGGVSNHYIITRPIHLFPYQDKIAYIEESGNPSLQKAKDDKQGIVLFALEGRFTTIEPLVLPLKARIGDVTYLVNDRQSLIKFAEENFTPQSWLERHLMSFRLVDEPHPNHCRH
ncbi:MAG TPA: hypothetical protein VEJ38_10695 [Candidatus Acidoferrales bacterium]|nr:hypothetical protein [Candidatus Acidoferrales bacterium]